MRMCLNRKVLVGLVVAAAGVLAVDPHLFARVLPLLFLAVCPLSMIVMMRGMSGNKASGGMGGCASMTDAKGTVSDSTVRVPPTTLPADAEVARLRAELDQLRAERSSSPPALEIRGLGGVGGEDSSAS